MVATPKDKKKIAQDFARAPADTGSSEVQVALLSERINRLTEHMKSNKKDSHSRRSLIMLVSKRQRHLNYLKKNRPRTYREVMEKLKLRG